MLVFKFGGASVKSADAVKNVAKIISLFPKEKKLVVVSAMGKTTNAMEGIVDALWANKNESFRYLVDQVYQYHVDICLKLFPEQHEKLNTFIDGLFENLLTKIKHPISENYDFVYDQVVSLGEILSTKIVESYLLEQTEKAIWLDARLCIRTDNTYRNATVDWVKTQELISAAVKPLLKYSDTIITQGFISSTTEGLTTTLGREGSDYTSGIFAYCLEAKSVTIWKDVPGMLNADPKWFDETIKLPVAGSEEEQIKIITQSMADNFAKRIKDSPVDWHMLQRIWVDEEN